MLCYVYFSIFAQISFPIMKRIHSLLYVYFCSAQFRPRAAIHKLRSGWSPGWSREWSGLELGTRRPGQQQPTAARQPASLLRANLGLLLYSYLDEMYKKKCPEPFKCWNAGTGGVFFLSFYNRSRIKCSVCRKLSRSPPAQVWEQNTQKWQ